MTFSRRYLMMCGMAKPPVQIGQPPPLPGTLLWTPDYDAQIAAGSDRVPWFRNQYPTAPGATGDSQLDRIRLVSGIDVPGVSGDPWKPEGAVARYEIHPYRVLSVPPDAPDGDIGNGNKSRAESYDRYPLTGASSRPAEQWADPVGQERWYGANVYLPPDFVTTDDTSYYMDLTQWKGLNGGSPPQALEIRHNSWYLGGSNSARSLGGISKGAWTRLVFGFFWSTSAVDGWVEVWRNGNQVLAREARATMDIVGGEVDPIYLKQGIYRHSSWAVNHVACFGPYKVGRTRTDVMNP